MSIPLSCAARRASAARFLLRKAAPDDAFATRILVKRAFWKFKGGKGFERKVAERRSTEAYPLSFSFISALTLVINSTEVRHDNGNGKGDDQHTAQRANTADNLARNRLRHLKAKAAKEREKVNQRVEQID